MRSAMHAASRLAGRGPTDVDDFTSSALKSDYDMIKIV